MNRWIDSLREIIDRGEPGVLVSIAGVRGSAPREVGAKMIVTATQTIGSIGGGQLEYKCARSAVELIPERRETGADTVVRCYPLGADCGQCCGGVVDVLFERIAAMQAGWVQELLRLHREREPLVIVTSLGQVTGKTLVAAEQAISFGDELPPGIATQAHELLSVGGAAARTVSSYLFEPVVTGDFNIAVFGAGHVGAAVVDTLARLDCNIRWIDSRRNVFPPQLPANVARIESAAPAREVAAMPAGTYYLVMTHSHPLDFEICNAILARADFAYCGLIGSRTKRRRFEKIARGLGIAVSDIERLTCPIGIDGVSGKKPTEIAIAVSAQLLQLRDAAAGSGVQHAQNVHVLRP